MNYKLRIYLYGGIVLFIIVIFIGRYIRQAKSDALNTTYSSVVTVAAVIASPKQVSLTVEETGTIQGNKEAIIAAESGGQVEKWYVQLGDFVKIGEPILKLDDELYRLEYERANIAFEKARMDFLRIEKLYNEKSVTESDFENAKLMKKSAEVQVKYAQKTYEDATIKAPFSGSVASKFTEVGQMIERGVPVVQLVDLSTMKLTINVNEIQMKLVQIGSDAEISIPSIDEFSSGKVAAVGNRATTGTRTFPVEITFSGKSQLKSGMFARVKLIGSSIDNAIVLPRIAVLPDAGNSIVYLAKQNTAEKRKVKVLGYQGEDVVLEGIEVGDTVVTVGNQLLSHGLNLVVKMNGVNQ